MDKIVSYLITFAVGGFICLIGQLLIIRTKMTSARILVTFLLAGVFLQGIGVYKYIEEFAGSGVTVPIVGFGAALAKGAIDGAKTDGFLGVLTGPLKVTAVGITVAIISAYLVALIFKSKTKKS